jgi:pyruvate/2-oxoglutarate dehydrogenase complex dihydrolipoamide dehydrogenase (E3) component
MPTRALHEHVAELLACIETTGYAVRAASTLRLRVGAQVCAAVVGRACLNRRCVPSTLLRRHVQAWWRARA